MHHGGKSFGNESGNSQAQWVRTVANLHVHVVERGRRVGVGPDSSDPKLGISLNNCIRYAKGMRILIVDTVEGTLPANIGVLHPDYACVGAKRPRAINRNGTPVCGAVRPALSP